MTNATVASNDRSSADSIFNKVWSLINPDGQTDEANQDLDQPDAKEDAARMIDIMVAIKDGFTHEVEYTDSDGEIQTANSRRFAGESMGRNFVFNFGYLKRQQNAQCRKVEAILGRELNAKRGSEDDSNVTRYETWLENEEQKFFDLVHLERCARAAFESVFEVPYKKADGAGDKAPVERNRAAARALREKHLS